MRDIETPTTTILRVVQFDSLPSLQVGHYVEATRDLEVNEVILEDDAAVLGPDHDTVPVCLECLSRYTALSMMYKSCPVEESIKKAGGTAGGQKKNGFLPDKMMVPKVFTDDIATWSKWKEEVAKYFDDGKETI